MTTPIATLQLPSVAQTKLHPPQLRADLVVRSHLVDLLKDAEGSKRLILVSAPAGYGKTTLLAWFVQQETDVPTAWLLLDEEEDHLPRFIQAVVAALQQVVPTFGALTLTALASLPQPRTEFRRLMGVLINEILTSIPAPVLMVLDDLHTVREPDVYLALDYLLTHLPPQMHLLIASRYDPPLALARLRAANQLIEIRTGDLRFGHAETHNLLNEKMQLALTTQNLETLVGQTEGWITGIHLSASSLAGLPLHQRPHFLTQLAQHNRHIFEFLAEEVLDRQDDEHRTFLLQTSILNTLSPAHCRAVTGRADASSLLTTLYRRNLCLTDVGSTDEAGEPLYRYHALFQEFLRRRLQMERPEEIPRLHQRAAAVIQQPAQQIAHYLAAEQWQEAAQHIEEIGQALLYEGRLERLVDWLERLPVALHQQRPRLLYMRGALARQQGTLDEAETWLNQALVSFRSQDDEVGEGEVLMDLANLYSARHDFQRQTEIIRQALTKPLPAHSRVQLLIIRAWSALYQGRWDEVDRDLEEAIQVTLASNDRAAFNVLGQQLRDPFILLPDGMDRMKRYCQQALARYGDEISPIQAGAHSLLAIINLYAGEVDKAQAAARHSRQISSQLGGFVFIELGNDLVLSLVEVSRGDHAKLEAYMQHRLPEIEALSAARQWLNAILLFLGQSYLLQDRRTDADAIFMRMEAELSADALPEAWASHSAMAAHLAMDEGDYAWAEELLLAVVAAQRTFRHSRIFVDARLHLADLYLRWERPDRARPVVADLLQECEAAGMPGLFIQPGKQIGESLLRFAIREQICISFAQQTLHQLGMDKPPATSAKPLPIPNTNQALTPREAEVLQLIADGLSNQSIADELVITPRTVKSHVTHILRKLNVSSRTHAAAEARNLGLL